MATSKKKTRRQYRARPEAAKAATATPVQAALAGPGDVAGGPHRAAASNADKAAAVGQEYSHVISDLKRIGITAVAMFAILAALALIIT